MIRSGGLESDTVGLDPVSGSQQDTKWVTAGHVYLFSSSEIEMHVYILCPFLLICKCGSKRHSLVLTLTLGRQGSWLIAWTLQQCIENFFFAQNV